MRNFNIRYIWPIITKIGGEGFGTLDVFCRFYVSVSAKNLFLSFYCVVFKFAKAVSGCPRELNSIGMNNA